MDKDENDDDKVWNASAVILDIDSGDLGSESQAETRFYLPK